jgi:flagellar L-ring protein precursor FlgH
MRNKVAVCVLLSCAAAAGAKKKPAAVSPVDAYVAAASARGSRAAASGAAPGSLWYPGSQFSDLARDVKASQVDDLVTILVVERASAVASGTTKTSRQSSTKYSVGAIFGKTNPGGALANMADATGQQALDGQGATTRENVVSTTLSARVADVLPNGYLVIEGTKNVVVNSENQLVTVRAVARPFDISPDNVIRSDRLAELDVRINGKGVVGDAIRRPFILYRILLGLLPF